MVPESFSTADVAALLGSKTWQVQRLFSNGDLPEVQRFAGKRVITREMLPGILDALRRRGWAPAAVVVGPDVEEVAHA